MRGRLLEASDCQTLCPCWVGQSPDQNVSHPLVSQDGKQPIQSGPSSLSVALGQPATVGIADRFSRYVAGFAPEFWLDVDLLDRSATTGHFEYPAGFRYPTR